MSAATVTAPRVCPAKCHAHARTPFTPRPGRLSVRVPSPGVIRITVGVQSTDYRVGALPTGGKPDQLEFWPEKVTSVAVFIVGLSADGSHGYCDCRAGFTSGRCRHIAGPAEVARPRPGRPHDCVSGADGRPVLAAPPPWTREGPIPSRRARPTLSTTG